jgi:hypothetical protein
MKRKKVDVLRPNNVWESDLIKISQESGNYYFEIITETTSDIGEAVAIMMKLNKYNDPVWELKINNVNLYNVEPSKSLYWLSGGDDEWRFGNEYKCQWHECYFKFGEEFGLSVISIIQKSKTLKDIREEFIKNLNLTKLYEFALENKIA